MEGLLDRKIQDKLGLKIFFESNGYKQFKQELDLVKLGAEDAIDNLEKKEVGLDGLAKLNFKLGENSGLQKVLFVLEGLQSQLQERNSPPGR